MTKAALYIRNRFQQQLVRLATYLLEMERGKKGAVVLVMDGILCLASIFISFSLRVGALAFPLQPLLLFTIVALPLFVPIFLYSGAYSTIFRFVGGRTIFHLARACTIYAIPLIAIFLVWSVPQIPRTVALLHPMIFFGLAATCRIMVRHFLTEVVLPGKFRGGISRVLIYGAGSAGQQLASSIRHEPSLVPVGFIDDDVRLHRQKLDGMAIYSSEALEEILLEKRVDTVLLALPRIGRARRAQIVTQLRPHNLHVRTLPNIREIAGGEVSINDLRDVQIEDLLGRDQVQPNDILLGRTIVGKTVLVTGAGGSIGAELCRQIIVTGARRLVLLEISEFALYQIELELQAIKVERRLAKVDIVAVMASVVDAQKMAEVFAQWQPDTVFHAAAYKHVTLVEANQIEGISNNVLGTHTIVNAACDAGVANFILVSTDKAVRPTNVMGASKRAAEQVVQARAVNSGKTKLSIVRFGNVLGSSGSVVPLFRQQIEAGGPITLTHRDVTRFFMTIPEAAQLVIQAGGMAKGGEVFVLEMGEPVRIYDLARSMVELSGLSVIDPANPDGDIEIIEVGLRPGEKLYEELLIGNSPQGTVHDRIMMAEECFLPEENIETMLQELRVVREPKLALAVLKRFVPEFDHERDNTCAETA